MDTRSLPEPPVVMLSKLMDISALRQDTPEVSYWVYRRGGLVSIWSGQRIGWATSDVGGSNFSRGAGDR